MRPSPWEDHLDRPVVLDARAAHRQRGAAGKRARREHRTVVLRRRGRNAPVALM